MVWYLLTIDVYILSTDAGAADAGAADAGAAHRHPCLSPLTCQHVCLQILLFMWSMWTVL